MNFRIPPITRIEVIVRNVAWVLVALILGAAVLAQTAPGSGVTQGQWKTYYSPLTCVDDTTNNLTTCQIPAVARYGPANVASGH